jgi:thiamine-monophosphate kinase
VPAVPVSNEFQLIARYFAPLASTEPGALGLLDDAALVSVPAGRTLVVTTDMLVANVHFFADDPPESIGIKLLGVNLSDLAAMGAEPLAYVLSVALPSQWREPALGCWLAEFTAGLAQMQRDFGLALLGGDTVATPGPLSLAVTAFGTIDTGGDLRRSGAQPGDTVYVSGTIGDGAIGLRQLTGKQPLLTDPRLVDAVIERYRRPRPRVALGRALVGLVHACADVSDGLVADLGHICEASGARAMIEAGRVPLSEAARAVVHRDAALLSVLLSGGDDYELVFTAPMQHADAIMRAATVADVPVSAIGIVAEQAPGCPVVQVRDANGRVLDFGAGGWAHF